MDALVGRIAKETAKAGEKKAPIKSIKLKVKFDTSLKDKKKTVAKRMHSFNPHKTI